MCDGGVQERIDHALMKISDNILDLNTDAKKKRSLTVTISFQPNENDREDVAVEVSTNVKLAPESGLKTQLFINKDFKTGTMNITEHARGQIKGQLSLDDMGMSVDDSETAAEELGCDPETGEIIEDERQSNVIDMRQARSM
jgi:hypothetical protein